MQIEQLVNQVLENEGGFVDHPADRGGPTNHGVTQRTLAHWRKCEVSSDDVRQLSKEEACEIYCQMYWRDYKLDTICDNPVVNELLLDSSIQHDPVSTIKMLQRAIGSTPDGLIGPMTRAAAQACSAQDLAAAFVAERVVYYGKVVKRDPSQVVFIDGWLQRMARYIRAIPAA